MRKLSISCLLLGALCLAPRPAHAFAEIWGSVLVGGATGSGETNRDFFSWAGGAATGFEVGARFLFVSAYLDYLRFFGGGTGASLLGINLGGDGTIELSESFSLVIRIAGTYYVGSLDSHTETFGGETVVSQEVNTRGVGARGGLGLRYTFLSFLSVGITPLIGYHYFYGGADQDITKDHSSGWDFQALGYLRAGLGF